MGLGNQMFQYAAGLALSLEKKTEFKVDIFSYEGYKLRRYELENFFGVTTAHASREEIAQFKFQHPVIRAWNKIFPKNKIRYLGLPYEEHGIKKKLLTAYDFLMPPHKRIFFTEQYYHFNKNFFNACNDVYLQGYWMSWKYFDKYADKIRNAFTVKPHLVEHLNTVTKEILENNSVSVHIRRTDYTNADVVKLKGIIPATFYQKGIDIVTTKCKNVVAYIFSDDIEWVKTNINFDGVSVKYIDSSISKSAIEDFYLMTKCKHNIIANSTFSWWAAWLNNNADKIVIAPAKWYAYKGYNSKDVYPGDWTILNW